MRALDPKEYNLISSALRLWQETPVKDAVFLSIAEHDGEVMTNDEIDVLCDAWDLTHEVFLRGKGENFHPRPETSQIPPTGLETDPPDWRETSRLLLGLMDGSTKVNVELSKAVNELQPYKDELLKIAASFGEQDDPFSVWESISLLQSYEHVPPSEEEDDENALISLALSGRIDHKITEEE